MSVYKRYSDNAECMYFMMKDEKIFDKYTTVWDKVSNLIKKKFNSELIHDKKYLKVEKRFNTKESFQCFYIPVILLHSGY